MRVMIPNGVIPIPRAASTVFRSTWRIPTKVLVRIGGMPSTISARATLLKPNPRNAATIAIRASSGIPRQELPSVMANFSPLP